MSERSDLVPTERAQASQVAMGLEGAAPGEEMSLVAANTSRAVPDRPPGERYYRHPGDIVRLCVWSMATIGLLLFIVVAPASSDGTRADLSEAAGAITLPVRQLLLAGVQVSALLVPIGVVGALVRRRRWRRLGTLLVAAGAGLTIMALFDALLDEPPPVPGAIGGDAWLMSTRFPTLGYLGAAVAAATVGKPWLSRRWRRATDVLLSVLGVTMALAGNAGVPELLLIAAAGGLVGSAILVAVGAPNRRPSPATIRDGLLELGIAVTGLDVERAVGGRAQLYRVATADGPLFAKVYSQDSRDADLLYRCYRTAVLRDPGASTTSLASNVEHEALLLLLAERGGVACPAARAVVALADGSTVLAMEDVGGHRLDLLAADDIGVALLDDLWRQVDALHRCGLSHGALRAANVLVTTPGQVRVIDLGAGAVTAAPRDQAIDRAELLASLASIVGPARAVTSSARVLATDELAAAMPYLQPLALSAATRRVTPTSTLKALREAVVETTARDPVPLERLIRVRPRTVVMIATLTGAFYILLPQLANVDESITALGSANWWWLAGAAAMSMFTYLAAAVGMIGGVREPLPLVPTVQVAMASSFVNRVTPANVGGMALNVRYMQKAGIPSTEAVTGVGLNVVAGGIVHVALLVIFLAWARQGDAAGFSMPGGSKLLVAIPVVLAAAGMVLATRRGRRFVHSHVVPSVHQSLISIASVARSPLRLTALFGGSIGVTVAYITALACALAAFNGGLSYAQVGAVYLGASLIAAAAPTPGGLGALEAALVAGCTGLGVEPSIAVAAVLTYRLITFWLPVLPGWLCFHVLDRRNHI